MIPIPITLDDKKNLETQEQIVWTKYSEANIKELNIEKFIKENISLFFSDEESLLIVGEQVASENGGITDLIALDKDGNLVVIEIKRDKVDLQSRKEPFESQAIRYASQLASIKSRDEIIDKLFIKYLKKNDVTKTREDALLKLNEFIDLNDKDDKINQDQRIILIASSFDEQTLIASSWLISKGIKISCYENPLFKWNEKLFTVINRILPQKEFEGEYSEYDESEEVLTAFTRTYKPRIKEMFARKMLVKDADIRIRKFKDSDAKIIDEKSISYKNNKMSYNEWGQTITGWAAIDIYEWAEIQIKGEWKLFDDLRDTIKNEKTGIDGAGA